MAIAMLLKEEGAAIPGVASFLAIIQGIGKGLDMCCRMGIMSVPLYDCTLGCQSTSGNNLSMKFGNTYPTRTSWQWCNHSRPAWEEAQLCGGGGVTRTDLGVQWSCTPGGRASQRS